MSSYWKNRPRNETRQEVQLGLPPPCHQNEGRGLQTRVLTAKLLVEAAGIEPAS